MKRILLLFSVVLFGTMCFAQDSGNVVIHKDPRLDLLISKQTEINEVTTRNSRRTASGYRILVTSSNNRNKVIEAKTKIYREYPELKAYMMYQAPFFRLKVGNFRDRVEAEGYLDQLKRLFDTNIYVVPDVIEIRPEEN